MRISKLWAILAPAALLLAPAASFADTYQLFALHSDQGYFFFGMDDSGHVAITGNTIFGTYYTYLDGSSTGTTTTTPTFTIDKGTSCIPSVPSGGSVEHGVCNNGRDAFTGFIAAGQTRPNVYVGPTFQDIFTTGGEGLIFMNALGDIVFDDDFSDQWFEAIDLTTHPLSTPAVITTPEPSTLLLLATAMFAPFLFVRCRRGRASL